MTLVWLMTLSLEILASLVKTSSCTPSAKNSSSLSLLRFSNGKTAMLFSFLAAFETDPTIGGCVHSDGKMKNAVGPITRIATTRATIARRCLLIRLSLGSRGSLHRLVRCHWVANPLTLHQRGARSQT